MKCEARGSERALFSCLSWTSTYGELFQIYFKRLNSCQSKGKQMLSLIYCRLKSNSGLEFGIFIDYVEWVSQECCWIDQAVSISAELNCSQIINYYVVEYHFNKTHGCQPHVSFKYFMPESCCSRAVYQVLVVLQGLIFILIAVSVHSRMLHVRIHGARLSVWILDSLWQKQNISDDEENGKQTHKNAFLISLPLYQSLVCEPTRVAICHHRPYNSE